MPHPSIKTERAFLWTVEMYVIDSCVRVHHVSKHFWTLTIGETFVCKGNPRTLQMRLLLLWWQFPSWSNTYQGRSLKHVYYFCAKTKALFTWTTQLMDYILVDFNLVVCFQNRQSAKFNSCQYFWLYGMCKYYAYQMIAQLMEIIRTCLELRLNYDWWVVA